jgi:LmbE family N-acetylglucosaminyl deacetylase
MSRILGIGAHVDDLEIHSLGYILKEKAEVISLIMTANRERAKEAFKIASIYKDLIIYGESDSKMMENRTMIDRIEKVATGFKPDLILTHWQHDYHQDHRAVAYATQAACRGKKIWLWQYPDNSFMFLNDAFNVTVDIEDVLKEKSELLNVFQTQKDKFYMQEAKKLTKEFFKVSANL